MEILMTRDEIHTFLERFVKAWEKAHIPTLLACYTDNPEVVSPIFHTLTGRQQLEKSFHDLFQAFASWDFRIDDVLIDQGQGDRAVVLFTSHAVHRGEIFGVAPTGRRFENRGVFILTFEDGRIAKDTRLYDFTGMLVQLGVLRTKSL
jgi:steroid delta-isomerase-like uncharacterized protein